MELRHLRTFEAVARSLSITQAAKDLHYAQSSVSDQVQNLERDLGVELFDRTGRRLRLTSHGVMLAEYTDRIVSLVEEARWKVSQPADQLSVGALETLCTHWLPEVLVRYRRRFPRARVRVGQGNRGQLRDGVVCGDHDLCLTFGETPAAEPPLHSEALASEPLVVIVPPDHPLAERGSASTDDLVKETFLVTEQGCGFREMFDDNFGAGCGNAVEPGMEVTSIGALGACVAAGLGCALLPLVAVGAKADRGEVAVVRVSDADLNTSITMSWLERNSGKPILNDFQSLLRDRVPGAT